MFILKFADSECWIAPWDGDPGRTLFKGSARKFKTEGKAKAAAERMKKRFSYRKMNLIIEPI
jgi:hypothetical protein